MSAAERHQSHGEADSEPSSVRYLLALPGPRLVHIDATAVGVTGVPLLLLRSSFQVWLDAIHPDDRPRLQSILDEPIPGRHLLEYRIVRPDGSCRWMLDSVYVWQDARGELNVGGRALDTTREHELQERLLLQSQLLAAVGQAVLAVDAHGVVIYWNRSAERLFGSHAADVVGKRLEDAVPLAANDLAVEAVLAALQIDGSWERELVLPGAGLADRHVRLALSGLADRDGLPAGAVGIATDVTASRLAAAELERSREELRLLTSHVHVLREQEQARLAREIHDVLGQMLTALKLDVAWLERWLRTHAAGLPLASRVRRLAALVDEILLATRHLAQQLRPVALDDLGLEAAVEALLLDVGGRAEIATSLKCGLEGMPHDAERDTVSYRILQEALTNVVRHADATRVEVDLRYRDRRLELRVSDNGNGLPKEGGSDGSSMGRLGMVERARAIGGEVHWASEPEGGTTVTAWLPDRGPAHA